MDGERTYTEEEIKRACEESYKSMIALDEAKETAQTTRTAYARLVAVVSLLVLIASLGNVACAVVVFLILSIPYVPIVAAQEIKIDRLRRERVEKLNYYRKVTGLDELNL